MDIQKYGFYIGLGVVLFIYIILYIILIAPYSKEIRKVYRKLRRVKSNLNKELSNPKDIPNDRIIEYYKKENQKVKENLEKVKNFFKERDEKIEKWFKIIEEELEKTGNKAPTIDFFQAAYEKEKEKLIQYYLNKKEGLKLGNLDESLFNLEEDEKNKIENILPFVSAKNIVTSSLTKKVKKQFWIISYMLKILDKGKMEVLNKFRFLNWREELEEGSFFIKRDIEITGKIYYENIPILVKELLNNDYFFLNILEINIKRDNTYMPSTITIKVPWNSTQEKALEEWKKKNADKIKLPPVFITLKCRILDYEGTKKD